jgi:Trp operon repressor
MTPLSRWKLSFEDEVKIKKVLVREMAKVTNIEEMDSMIKVLLTETEQLMIAKRIFVFVLIDQGLSNMEIAKKLHFTRATVDRLRVTYTHLAEKNTPVKKIVKQFGTSEILKLLIKKFSAYAVPAVFGKIPR